MPVATKCQIFSINGQTCDKPTYGFVVCHEDSAMAVYKAGVVLCRAHGNAVRDITPHSQLVTSGELEDMMIQEDMKVHKSTAKEQTDDRSLVGWTNIILGPAKDIPMSTAVAEQEIDLHALAQHVNGSNVDSHTAQETKRVEVPKPEEPPKATEHAPITTTSKAKQVQELRAKADSLHAEAQKVLEQADLMPLAASALREVARKMEKEAKSFEAQAQQLLEPDVKIVNPRGAAYVALRQAVYRGGMEALKALDEAIDGGMFGKKAKAATSAKNSEETSSTPTPEPTADDTAREALRLKVRELVSLGWRDGAIAKQLGIPDSTVYSIRKRMAKAA